MSTQRLSLAEQLAQLDQAAPVDFEDNFEDLVPHERDSDGEGQTVSSAARDHYYEVSPSSLRKAHDIVTDPKYKGAKTSRKDLEKSEEDEGTEDQEDEDDDEGIEGEEGYDEDNAGEDEEADLDDVVIDPQALSESKDKQGPPSENENEIESENRSKSLSFSAERHPTPNDLKNTLQKTREADIMKGKAVMRQMNIWDSLLDARIRIQKVTTTVNRFETLDPLSCQEELTKYLEESILLAEELFELEENILNINESTTLPPRKKRRILEDDDLASQAAYFTEATTSTANLEQVIHPWLVQTLGKWSAKIQAVAPSVLLPSNRNAFSKKSHVIKSAVDMVNEALSDYPRLLRKTRTTRGKVKSEVDDDGEEDIGVFDDTDFYQQLLRDVIESRGDGTGGMDDWIALQHEKKAKKKVDTKASKGRKLRYETLEKLQNFMVPVPIIGAWHEEQIDELFASLLGKGFENPIVDEGPFRTEKITEAISDGFRIFG